MNSVPQLLLWKAGQQWTESVHFLLIKYALYGSAKPNPFVHFHTSTQLTYVIFLVEADFKIC